MALSKEALIAAYKEEVNSCSFNIDLGVRTKARPHKFCDSVTIEKTLTVTDLEVTGQLRLTNTAGFDAGRY